MSSRVLKHGRMMHHREWIHPGAVFIGLAAVLFAVATDPASARQDTTPGTIQGVLLDVETGQPVRQGVVRLTDADGQIVLSLESDWEGRFLVRTPGPGTYRLRVDCLGYQTKESGGFYLPPGYVLSVEVHLGPEPLPLDSMAVVGRHRPLAVTEQLIQGRLLDRDSGAPVSQGTVYLLKVFGPWEQQADLVSQAMSNDRGFFTLISPLPGTYRLRGERIGYRTSEGPDLHMMPGDTVLLDLFLSVEAIVLDPITVTASARPWGNRYNLLGMDAFFYRQSRFGESGFGTFLTRDSIARYDGEVTTGHMLLSSAMEVRWVNQEGGVVLNHGCNPRYYLDGVEIVRGDPVNQSMFGQPEVTPTSQGIDPELLYPPETLEGIELYVSPRIPAEFNPGFPCGVVALWTRRR